VETEKEALVRLREQLLQLPFEHPMKYADPILIYRGMVDMEGNLLAFQDKKENNALHS
jgi:hypothetical protein